MPTHVLCAFPFTMAEIGPGGNVMVCCGLWSRIKSIGNLKEQSLYSIWNGEVARALRRAMYNNSVEHFCNGLTCPVVKAGKVIPLEGKKPSDYPYYGFNETILADMEDGNDFMNSFPTRFSLSFDDRCNLSCVMCPRSSAHPMFDGSLAKKVFSEIREHGRTIRSIMLSGHGDPFVIPDYRQFLQNSDPAEYPNLKVIVLTNGQLLDERMWETIKHNRFEAIKVSVDAATKETYSKIRGGNWDRLRENLAFIGRLRREGAFPLFEINMTVMRANYEEVYEFVELGRSVGATSVLFQMIFDTWHDQNYLFPAYDRSIVNHLRQFLKSPEARSDGVNVSGLLHLLDVKEEDMVRIQPKPTEVDMARTQSKLAETEAQRDRLRAEVEAQRAQIRSMTVRLQTLEQLLLTLEQLLRTIQAGRAYRLLRSLGRWKWVESTLAALPADPIFKRSGPKEAAPIDTPPFGS